MRLPRKERVEKSINKQYEKAANAKGQTKINFSFFQPATAMGQLNLDTESDTLMSTESLKVQENADRNLENQ